MWGKKSVNLKYLNLSAKAFITFKKNFKIRTGRDCADHSQAAQMLGELFVQLMFFYFILNIVYILIIACI
jgi:hypothetical protein